MITLTKLNTGPLAVDPDLIERVDGTPQTVLTMVDGTKHMVKESLCEVVELSRLHRAAMLAKAFHVQVSPPQPLGELLVLARKPRRNR
jgi:flagellar protein FlbD